MDVTCDPFHYSVRKEELKKTSALDMMPNKSALIEVT